MPKWDKVYLPLDRFLENVRQARPASTFSHAFRPALATGHGNGNGERILFLPPCQAVHPRLRLNIKCPKYYMSNFPNKSKLATLKVSSTHNATWSPRCPTGGTFCAESCCLGSHLPCTYQAGFGVRALRVFIPNGVFFLAKRRAVVRCAQRRVFSLQLGSFCSLCWSFCVHRCVVR